MFSRIPTNFSKLRWTGQKNQVSFLGMVDLQDEFFVERRAPQKIHPSI